MFYLRVNNNYDTDVFPLLILFLTVSVPLNIALIRILLFL